MRYDLVVNTFIKSAFQTGELTVHCGGEMWRPMVDVTDAAKCYLACLEAEPAAVAGKIYNVAYRNYRVLELAHRFRKALEGIMSVDIQAEYGSQTGRSYRVSSRNLETGIGFKCSMSVEESALNMARQVMDGHCADFENPKYYNIRWLETLIEMDAHLKRIGSIF